MIKDCMKKNVVSITKSATILDAALLVAGRHVGILPVVDEDKKLVGMIALQDLLALELPPIIGLIDEIDFVTDFGAIETTRPSFESVSRSILDIMQPPTFVNEDSGLLYAYALMVKHKLFDLPVVNKEMTLVGIVSRVDIAAIILSNWKQIKE
jgi:CBS domain-containing protein